MNFTQFPIDSPLFPEGVERCSLVRFSLWIFLLFAILGLGLIGAGLVLWKGLNQTNMNDYFGFAL